MTQEQKNIRGTTWWIFSVVGLFIGLANSDSRFRDSQPIAMGLVGVVNGAWIGWLFGYIIDKIKASGLISSKPSEKKELQGLLHQMQEKIFPNGQAQIEKEVNDVRTLLDYAYTKEDVKQTYVHAAAIYFVSNDRSPERITQSILMNKTSVVTKNHALLIHQYLQKKFENNPIGELKNKILLDSNDSQLLFFNTKGGIVELKKAYKDLTDGGKFEVIIFNSLLALRVYRQKHSEKYEQIQIDYFKLLVKQAEAYKIEWDSQTIIRFINSRFKFYASEIDSMYNVEGYIPAEIYNCFYASPLIEIPKREVDLMEVLKFYKALPIMMNWVTDNAKKI